jgi:hypothetical protein
MKDDDVFSAVRRTGHQGLKSAKAADLTGLPEAVDVYGKWMISADKARTAAFPTAVNNLLETAKARFPQPLGKVVPGVAQLLGNGERLFHNSAATTTRTQTIWGHFGGNRTV